MFPACWRSQAGGCQVPGAIRDSRPEYFQIAEEKSNNGSKTVIVSGTRHLAPGTLRLKVLFPQNSITQPKIKAAECQNPGHPNFSVQNDGNSDFREQ